MKKWILGISAFYHDSAAALLEGDESSGSVKILAAAQEERFTRIKNDSAFPSQSIRYCLEQAGISLDGVAFVAFYDKPFLKFERLIQTYLAVAPRGLKSFAMSMPVWLKEKLFQKNQILRELKLLAPAVSWEPRLLFSEHHLSHAASAFFASPFKDALILTLDGVGEWTTSSVAIGRGNQIEILKELHFPHSLGLLYSAFTYYCGFKVNSDEYKVMGLAPYGVPRYRERILEKLIDLKDDGSFRLNMDYFDYCTGDRMTNRKFDLLFDGPRREPDTVITQKHQDLAASIQAVTEEVMLKMVRSLVKENPVENLCLAGGVALNCVANGKIQREGIFKDIWIQPAAGDAGGALGAALAAHYLHLKNERKVSSTSRDLMQGAFLGPEFENVEIKMRLVKAGAKFQEVTRSQMLEMAAQALAEGKALGWFQGRMEFGPRALGARSILADPRSPTMQSQLNLKIKFRESFRPFAPAVMREELEKWFDLRCDSPYMLLVADVNKNAKLPAVTHVDNSARVQTVHRETKPVFYELLERFKALTGCPVLVNTSFNVRDEPIVCTPEDAFRCFMNTDLDMLAIGDFILRKSDQS